MINNHNPLRLRIFQLLRAVNIELAGPPSNNPEIELLKAEMAATAKELLEMLNEVT